MWKNSRKIGIVKLADLDMTILLLVYFVLAIEYDLYTFFGFGSIISGTMLTIVEIMLLLFVIVTTQKKVVNQYILYAFLFCGIAATYFFAPECRELLKELFFEGSSFKKIIIFPLAFQCIKDPEKFGNSLYKLCIVEGYIHVICNAVWGYGYNEWGVFNYMTYGLALLIPTCIVMQRVFSKPSKCNILTFIIFEINIVIYGHRGALLVTVAMMLIFFVKYIKVEKKVLISLLGIAFLVVIFFFQNQLIEFILNFMESAGLESRTLEKLLTGDITNDSERNTIWAILISRILDNFPFGAGIGADRLILKKTMRDGLYAHNFIIEILLNYGILLGALVVGWILKMCYDTLFKIKDTAWSQLITPFLIPSVITLLTSTSIYQYSFFWVAAGLYYCYFGRGRDGEKMRYFKIKFKK